MSLKLVVAISAQLDLLLRDEATNGLDVVVRRQIVELLMDLAARQGTTLVMATHLIEDVERVADTVAMMYRGHVVLDSSLDDLKVRFTRLQVVMRGNWPSDLHGDGRILRVERQGSAGLLY